MRLLATTTKLLFLFLILLSGITVMGQSRPAVKGSVSDGTLKENLPGAVITLTGPTTLKTIADANGQYLFVNVPQGKYKMRVTYVNYKSYDSDIEITSSGDVNQNIEMTSLSKVMTTVVVVGNRFGQAKALNSQKEAVNIKNIVSEEQIERFPDINTADVLQRVPGVTVQRSAGEGRFVGLRGTNPTLTNITVNGSLLATSNGSDRLVELDVINAGQLGGLEVSKVITPDMDANAIGGSINLKTRSAFDYKSRLLNVMGGVGYSAGVGFRSAVNYADKLGAKKKIGISLSASFTRTNREENSNEQMWGDRTSTTNAVLPMALRQIILRRSNNVRDRLGLSAQLEYKFNEKSRIRFSGMMNKRWDDQWRNDFTARIDQGKYVSSTEVTGARFIKASQERVERQQANAFEFGGLHQLGKLKVDYQLSYSNAYTKKSDGQLGPEFRFNSVNVKLRDLDTYFPNYDVTNSKDVYNGTNYAFDVTDYRFENTNNHLYTGGVNFALPLKLAKTSTGEFKFGGKFRSNQKDRKDTRQQWKWAGTPNLNIAQFEDANETISDFQDGHYSLGKKINTQLFRDFFNANQSATGFTRTDRPDVNFGEPYEADEDVTGVYMMATQTFNKLLILAGVRAEFVSTDYMGNNLVLNNNTFVTANESRVKRSFENFFPNLQFRYRLSPATNLRLAYSQGVAYPNFYDLVPYSITNIDPSSKTITKGNGYLDPTSSRSYDLLAEHFFKGIGIISGGVFYKDLDKFIFSSIGTEASGPYAGYRVTQPVNGEGAQLYGAEISWQQQFTFLPGFLDGFGIYANYTYTKAEKIELGTITRDDVDVLPQQLKDVGNLALTYEKYGLNARLAANFSGKYIDKIGQNAENDEWVTNYTQLDFSASQRFLKHFDAFFEWQNILNRPGYIYTGRDTRSRKFGSSYPTFYFGLKWSLN